jgi:hypothetical protein
MTLRTRRIFLFIAIVFFLLVTPTLVLYACGYSLDWTTKKIVLTGGFRLKSLPNKATIYIDGRQKGQTPRGVTRLIPKEYIVKVEKDGYHVWQKKLKIEEEKVTEAINILLIPKTIDTQTLLTDLPEDFNIVNYFEDSVPEPDHFLSADTQQNAGYIVSGSSLYYIAKPSFKIIKSNLDGSNMDTLYDQSLEADLEYQLYIINNHLLIHSSDAKLYLFDIQNRELNKIANDIIGVQACSDNKKFLYYSSNEIWVYYIAKKEIQPYQEADTKELITRISKPIRSAIWYPKTNEHIIYAANGNIKIIELDYRDVRNIHNLIDTETSQLHYNIETQYLYFIQNDTLKALSLIKND